MTEHSISLNCPTCGSVPVELMRIKVYGLLEKHGIAETLDTLTSLVIEESELKTNQPIDREWAKLRDLLEEATQQALTVQNLQQRAG